MPTFSTGYIEPGTYVKVKNQVVPPAVQPAFVTAIIGTTSTDKPVAKSLTRDDATRRDLLDTTVTTVTSIVDEYGVGYVYYQDWEAFISGGSTYIEWAGQFRSSNAISGVTFLPFSSVAPAQNVDTPDGTANLVYTISPATLTWDGGAGVVVPTDGTYYLTGSGGKHVRVDVVVANLPVTGQTDVVTVTTAGPTDAVDYTVDYRKNKTTADLAPANFDDLDALQAFHGAVTNSNSYPETSNAEALSVGAAAYFDAGGGSVIAVPVRDKKIDTVSGWDIYNATASVANAAWGSAVQEALTALEDQGQVSCVVVLSPTEKSATTGDYRPAIYSGVLAHVNKMNQTTEGKPRMALLGARANTTTEATFIDSAGFASNEYIVYMAPATATKTVGGFSKLLNGASLAAGVAGILSNPEYNAGEPVSGKSMTMFDSITDPFAGRLQRNRIAGAGVTLIEIQNGSPVIRHFLSTNQNSILTGEAKVAKIKIDSRRKIRQTLNATIVNKRLVDGETLAMANSLVGLVLNQMVQDQIIVKYIIESIKINSIDARQLDVKVQVKPTFDLNYVYVTETFVTTL